MEEACKDEAEAARAAAAAEVASLLASPPTWLDLDGPHDAALSALNFNVQRAKGPRCAKLAWRWQCSIKGPAGSPYAGDSYRVLVRFPLGYPQLPPRLQVLSIIHHIEVDLRDPFEGKLDDLFYEKLAERAAWDAGSLLAEAEAEPAEAEPEAEPPTKRPRTEEAAGPAEAGPAEAEASAAAAEEEVPVEAGWMAPEPRFSLRGALELFEAMLGAPLESLPTGQERLAWETVAERHAEGLKDASTFRQGAIHPEIFGAAPQPDWLAPGLAAALAGPAEGLRGYAEEVAPGVFSFEMLSASYCDRLLAELERFEASGLPPVRPNSMNNYGVVLNAVGFEKAMDALQRQVVAPLTAALFPQAGGDADHHHTFMVQYKQGEDLGLDMHTDASDVTLNVCLGKEFSGAGLTFCGVRGVGTQERRFSYRHTHAKGRAILHLGHHRHGADDIETGERYNLIMWCKSSSYRLSHDFLKKYQKPPTREATPPDLVCLSYTHDDDYEDYLHLAPEKRAKREASRRAG